MKAITVQQPWAGLLVLGIKRYETRSWNTKHRGRIAIHSSAKVTAEGKQLMDELCEMFPDRFFEGSRAYEMCTSTGHVLGLVKIEDTYSTNVTKPKNPGELMLGDYSPGRWFWWCREPEAYLTPIPATGRLMIWEWDDSQERF